MRAGPGPAVEPAGATGPYAFTCEERHMNPKSRVTGTVRAADAA
ncbi:hypothetical protein [Streptomyces sp. 3211]|nr:hypothetical protein [Streptomyces sp. 3211]